MSQKDEALEVLAGFIEENGPQASRLQRVIAHLSQMIETEVTNHGSNAQSIIGPIEKVRADVQAAAEQIAGLGADMEATGQEIEGLGQ